MDYRPLGRTGVSVSQLCLGAMMFGAFGNADHDDSIRDHPPRARRRHQLHRHRRLLLRRRVGGDRRQGAGRRPPRRRRARHEGRPAVRRGPQPPRHLAALDHAGGRGLAAPARHRLDRPLPGAPPRPGDRLDETLGVLSDLVHAGKIRTFGASTVPASEIVEAQWIAERRGRERFRTEQPPYSILTRAVEHDVLPTASATAWACSPTARSPAAGSPAPTARAARSRRPGSAARRNWFAAPYDAPRPTNAAKLDAADALGHARRRGRHDADPAGDRVRRPPPGRHLRDRRPAHAWSTSSPTSPPTASSSPTTCSTASTRSSRRNARSSTAAGTPGGSVRAHERAPPHRHRP